LRGDYIWGNTLEEQLCSSPDAECVTWHGRVTSGDPDTVTTSHEPGLGHGSPRTAGSLKREEWSMRGDVEIGFKMTDESCEGTSGEVACCNTDISAFDTRCLCPGNADGSVTCINGSMNRNRKYGAGDMFDGVEGIWPRYDELTQTGRKDGRKENHLETGDGEGKRAYRQQHQKAMHATARTATSKEFERSRPDAN